jgi:hypothetical protein
LLYWEDFVDAAPLLVGLGVAFVEDDAVAGFQGGLAGIESHAAVGADGVELDDDAAAGGANDGADADAAGLGEARRDELGVVDAGEEAVGEAAGEDLGEAALLLIADCPLPIADCRLLTTTTRGSGFRRSDGNTAARLAEVIDAMSGAMSQREGE